MRRSSVTRALFGAIRSLLAIATSVGALLLLVGALVLVQAQRDETRPAGAAVVLSAEGWGSETAAMRQARLDHALDLYQRGVVSRIILTGGAMGGSATSDAVAGQAYLAERGVPEGVLLLEDAGLSTRASLLGAAARAREAGIGSVLLVSDPMHMLRSLKIARDTGLAAYASPAFNSPTTRRFTTALSAMAHEAWAYTVYIFAGR